MNTKMTARMWNTLLRQRPELTEQLGHISWNTMRQRYPHMFAEVRRMTRKQLITKLTYDQLGADRTVSGAVTPTKFEQFFIDQQAKFDDDIFPLTEPVPKS
jgi:hypothetical protein